MNVEEILERDLKLKVGSLRQTNYRENAIQYYGEIEGMFSVLCNIMHTMSDDFRNRVIAYKEEADKIFAERW